MTMLRDSEDFERVRVCNHEIFDAYISQGKNHSLPFRVGGRQRRRSFLESQPLMPPRRPSYDCLRKSSILRYILSARPSPLTIE